MSHRCADTNWLFFANITGIAGVLILESKCDLSWTYTYLCISYHPIFPQVESCSSAQADPSHSPASASCVLELQACGDTLSLPGAF